MESRWICRWVGSRLKLLHFASYAVLPVLHTALLATLLIGQIQVHLCYINHRLSVCLPPKNPCGSLLFIRFSTALIVARVTTELAPIQPEFEAGAARGAPKIDRLQLITKNIFYITNH